MTKIFKGLDLVDRMPEELWTEVRNTVQRQGPKPSQRKRNARRQNDNLKALQIPEERNERQRRKGKIYLTECRVPENSEEQ